MQAVSDSFLGWTKSPTSGTEYYVRQLHDMKYGVDIAGLREPGMRLYARSVRGRSLGRTRDPAIRPRSPATWARVARSTRRSPRSRSRTADQTERDYAALAAAVRSGRLAAETGI